MAGQKDLNQPNPGVQQGPPVGQGAGASGNPLWNPGSGPVQVVMTHAPLMLVPTRGPLSEKRAVSAAFPPCTNELLALVTRKNLPEDDLSLYFTEYFKPGSPHQTLVAEPNDPLTNYLSDELLRCKNSPNTWPSECCFCPPCVTLDGQRPPADSRDPGLKRLFTGDLVWLFYFERMGVFQILGAILDAYAYSGRLPISNGSLDVGLQDDIIALVLEAMVRQTKTGLSSTVRDRAAAYRTALGWVSEPGRKLSLDTLVGTGLNSLFHKFIFHALEFYKDKRLAFAIRGAAADQPPASAATLVTLRDTIDVLKRRFEAFSYGRVYTNTLSGIVWAIAAMSVVRELRSTIGIPAAFNTPDEYLPAAYDLLVLKRPPTQGETNRYLVHKECARNGRDILLDLEVLNHNDIHSGGGDLDRWLGQIEPKIEGYRTAYRTLTGVDLGASATPVVEQQA